MRSREVAIRILRQVDFRVGRMGLASLLARHYEARNRASTQSVTGDVPVVVSLTTYGRRIETVHLAIESISAGRARPKRIILWLDDPEQVSRPPATLQRLIDRGLEIRLTDDLGSHKKYYPSLAEFPTGECRCLVTADDDILYPRWWLERLWRGVESHPGEIICHRAHHIRLIGQQIAPYDTWPPCEGTRASLRNFATSGAGAAYPPTMIKALQDAGLSFREIAPKADDVWLSAVAARNGILTRQLEWRPRMWPCIPGSQTEGLFQTNVVEGGNDRQVAAAYTPELVTRLVDEAADTPPSSCPRPVQE